MPRNPRLWNPENLQLLLAVLADMAEPIPGSRLRVLVGPVTIDRDAALVYKQRYGPLPPYAAAMKRPFEAAHQILIEAGALESPPRGRKRVNSRRQVDPTVVITQAHVDAYYRKVRQKASRRRLG